MGMPKTRKTYPGPNLGQPFYEMAVAYRTSADLLLEALEKLPTRALELQFPNSFLYSHAFELFFKAFLRMRGVSARALGRKPYRHDLRYLYGDCRRLGLVLDIQDEAYLAGLVANLDAGHSEYEFRYFESVSLSTAALRWMRRELTNLANAVATEVAKEEANYWSKLPANCATYPAPVGITVTVIGRE
jgi:hypothetical protein